MIRFSLRCANSHDFESWFGSNAAFDTLKAAGQLTCPLCGSVDVEKALMAPAVSLAPEAERPLSKQGEMEKALAEMRRQVEENSEYVGMNFATEARAIHDGDAPERAIYGEAKFDDARRLLEDGVPVAPLPFMPPRKTN